MACESSSYFLLLTSYFLLNIYGGARGESNQDMPILGYGKSSLAHDRLYSFHNTLSGHSLNYISRGTYWGTEQRQQLDYGVGNRTVTCHIATILFDLK